MKWDVFLSYSNEDKASVALPLAQRLRSAGLRVWFDESELKVGDSVREKLDHGLAHSSYCVVILSESSLSRYWPIAELNALFAKEGLGPRPARKRILPVLHEIDHQTVSSSSLLLADRVAITTAAGLDQVSRQIVDVVCRCRDKDTMKDTRFRPFAGEPARKLNQLHLSMPALFCTVVEIVLIGGYSLFAAYPSLAGSFRGVLAGTAWTMLGGVIILEYIIYAKSLRCIARQLREPDGFIAWVPLLNIFYLVSISRAEAPRSLAKLTCLVLIALGAFATALLVVVGWVWPLLPIVSAGLMWSGLGRRIGRSRVFAFLAGVPIVGKFVALDLAKRAASTWM